MAKIVAVMLVCVIAAGMAASGWWVLDTAHPLKALATAVILIVVGAVAAIASVCAEG